MSSQQCEKPDLPHHKPGSPWDNWRLSTTSQLQFFALHNPCLGPFYTMIAGSCPKVDILWCSRVCCRDLGWNGSNNTHSLEEQFVHLATSTSIVAPVWVARLLWSLPRQAKPPLYCGWHWIWNKSHWPWNVKSTMWKARSSPTQTWIPLGKLEAIYNFAASILFALHNPCLGPFDTMIAGSCPKVILLVQPRLL